MTENKSWTVGDDQARGTSAEESCAPAGSPGERDEMRTHLLPDERLELFLRANGLRVNDEGLLTPDGAEVGRVTACGPRHLVLVPNELYRVPPITVEAWWPGFRTAWRITGSDGTAVGPTLGPDTVVCDLCNRSIRVRPVPVVDKHALCRHCFGEMDLPFPGKTKPYIPELAEETWSK